MLSKAPKNILKKSASEPNLSSFFKPSVQLLPEKKESCPPPSATVKLSAESFNLMTALYEELKLSNNLKINQLITHEQEMELAQKQQEASDEKFENEIKSTLYV